MSQAISQSSCSLLNHASPCQWALLRRAALNALDPVLSGPLSSSPGLSADLFRAFNNAAGDPDVDLPSWLRSGAPIGIILSITPCGVFLPSIEPGPSTLAQAESLCVDPFGWTNYRSAEDDPHTCRRLIERMVSQQMATEFPSWESLIHPVGSPDVVLNRIGLISKQRTNLTWKQRIIWDLRRSGVKSFTRQSERAILPRLADVANDLFHLLARRDQARSTLTLWTDFTKSPSPQ